MILSFMNKTDLIRKFTQGLEQDIDHFNVDV